MINPTTYETVGMPLGMAARSLTQRVGGSLVDVHRRIIRDPDLISGAGRFYNAEVNKALTEWNRQWKDWADQDLATAYLRGAEHTDAVLRRMNIRRAPDGTISEVTPMARHYTLTPPQSIPAHLRGAFRSVPNHLTFYNVFRRAAYHNLEGTTLQVLRAANDLYRDVAVQAGSQMFREADIFTRRQLSQSMLNDFARRGIQSVVYRNGRRMSIEAYSEMVGRTMSGHAAVQGSLNRYEEYGYDLVRISSHFRACDLCVPYEGRVLSMSGQSPHYPSLDDAVAQGLFHPNCFVDKQVKIFTSRGWIALGDIEVGDLVLTHRGRFRKVTKLHRNQGRPRLVKIKVNGPAHGKRKGCSSILTVTEGHPLLVDGKWIRAEGVKFGSKIRMIAKSCEVRGEEVCRVLANHNDEYLFMDVEITEVNIRESKKTHQLYNISVEEDESYIAKGFVVHNCAHDVNPYFPGLSPKQQVRVSPDEQRLIDQHGYRKAQEIAYKAQQQQRYIERNIRNWKMREVTSLDTAAQAKARRKVLDWQGVQRAHLKKNSFLPRKYYREGVPGYRDITAARRQMAVVIDTPTGVWGEFDKAWTTQLDKRMGHLLKKYPISDPIQYGNHLALRQKSWDQAFEREFLEYKKLHPRTKDSVIRERILKQTRPRPTEEPFVAGEFWFTSKDPYSPTRRGNRIGNIGIPTHTDTSVNNALSYRRAWLSSGNNMYKLSMDCPGFTLIHEYGHALAYDYQMGIEGSRVLAYFNSLGGVGSETIKSGLSTYAATNLQEFVAEAFLEGFLPNPRPIGIAFHKLLKGLLGGV